MKDSSYDYWNARAALLHAATCEDDDIKFGSLDIAECCRTPADDYEKREREPRRFGDERRE